MIMLFPCPTLETIAWTLGSKRLRKDPLPPSVCVERLGWLLAGNAEVESFSFTLHR